MTKKHRIRIGIIIVIICMISFPDRSFAAETTEELNKDLKILGRSLNMIVGRLSRLWIIFAKLAGELLTNKRVYGGVIGLDVLLRKYWNVAKNFANFGLGFYFVYILFKGLIGSGKDSIEKTLKDTLLWLLIAGVGIQASWFLTATVIDLSTIAMTAAGSFPSIVMSNNSYVEGEVKNSIRKAFAMEGDEVTRAKIIDVGEGLRKTQFVDFVSNETKGVAEIEPKSMKELVDILQPQPEDVSGPLYFIGFSILNIKNITTINSSDKGIKATLFNTIIQGGTTIIYGIEMAVLCIAAIMRILYLWMFIMISPIAILLWCIQQSGEKIGGNDKNFLGGLMTQIKFETFLVNVFKPAIVVLGLGVAATFAGLMSNIVAEFSEKTFTYEGITFNSEKNDTKITESDGDIKYTSTIEHNLFSVTLLNAGKTFLELVLSVLTVILVYLIIKAAITMGNGKDFIGKRIDSIQNSVGDMLGSVPIVPVPGYDNEGVPTTNYIGASRVFGFGGKESLFDTRINNYKRDIRVMNQNDEKLINERFDKNTPGVISAEEENKINQIMGSGTKPQENLKNMRDEIGKMNGPKGMTLTGENNVWKREFEGWLNLMKNQETKITERVGFPAIDVPLWKGMVSRWNDEENKDNRTLENMFRKANSGNEAKNVQAYARFFLGDSYVSRYTTRGKLEILDISGGNDSSNGKGKDKKEDENDKSPASGGETTTSGGGNTQTSSS